MKQRQTKVLFEMNESQNHFNWLPDLIDLDLSGNDLSKTRLFELNSTNLKRVNLQNSLLNRDLEFLDNFLNLIY